MADVCVYMIQSPIARPEMVENNPFLAAVEKELGRGLRVVSLEEFEKAPFGLVFIATGGSEGGFLKDYDRLKAKPIIILTSGESNSLAASMEILSFLQEQGCRGEILHGDKKVVAARIDALEKAAKAKEALTGIRLGIVGKPSDWLISSLYNAAALKKKLGIELVEITMDELLAEIARSEYAGNQWTDKLLSMGYDKSETEKALCVYGAFKRLVEKYKLGGVTVRCFDLLSTVRTTGCLGLAILNAEGIYGGCEGDVPSLVSMCILGAVSGKPVFMCNPSRINTAEGNMVLAHCTLPVNMPTSMQLTTHFESGIGVAIAGNVPEGPCTVFKTNGDLSRHFAAAGKMNRNMRESTLCRTQIEVSLPDYSYFLKNPIHNHHIVCTGDVTSALEAFFDALSV